MKYNTVCLIPNLAHIVTTQLIMNELKYLFS